MKHLKSILLCLLALVLCFGTVAAAAEIPDPDPVLLYVTDLAGVLSADTEEYIATKNDTLYAATGAQFAILTAESLPAGYDSESYCYEVFNAWGVGSAEKNNGLLLLLVPDEGKFWMVSGTGLQSRFSGGMISELLDEHLAEDFDAGRYDDGVLALFDAVWSELETLYGEIAAGSTATSPDQNSVPVYTPEPEYSYDHMDTVNTHRRTGVRIAGFVLLVAVVIVLCIVLRPGRRYYTRSTPPPPGSPPYYRAYPPRPRRTMWHFGPMASRPPVHRPPVQRQPNNTRPNRPGSGSGSGRPGGGYSSRPSSSRPSSSNRSFGGGSSGRSSGGSRSFGGGRSHGGGGGRR